MLYINTKSNLKFKFCVCLRKGINDFLIIVYFGVFLKKNKLVIILIVAKQFGYTKYTIK